MIIILVILTVFISIGVDYFSKLRDEKKREEEILKEAIIERKTSYNQALYS